MKTKVNRIKQLRKESKLTQEQLAQYLNVNQSMITQLESGMRKFNATLIEKICCLFGCSELYLMGEDEAYIPLNLKLCSNTFRSEDLESIAAINKIVRNIRYMNEKLGE